MFDSVTHLYFIYDYEHTFYYTLENNIYIYELVESKKIMILFSLSEVFTTVSFSSIM